MDPANSSQTSPLLAVKRFARTVSWPAAGVGCCCFCGIPAAPPATCTLSLSVVSLLASTSLSCLHIPPLQIDEGTNAPHYFRTRGALRRTMQHLRNLLDK